MTTNIEKFNYPAYQFAFFRAVFGLYLFIHFLDLTPIGFEIWSNTGMISDVTLNMTYGTFPSILYIFNEDYHITSFLTVMSLLSFFVMIGFWRRTSALLLWYGWACLLHQNNLILNPGIPMVGWLLLALAIIPDGEGYSVENKKDNWEMPSILFWGAWIIVGISYTISGIDKAMAPSWIDGSAITHLLNNPLARDYFLRDWLLATPEFFREILTWSALILEIFFGALVIFSRTRMFAWLMIMTLHIGILLIVDFPDLTLGVVMIHLFTFDHRWFKPKSSKSIVLFDGVCGFCNKSVDTIMKLDTFGKLKYSPLQGEFSKSIDIDKNLDSIAFYVDGNIYYKSTAILKILRNLGGVFILSNIFYIIPKFIRDFIYDIIAKYRYDIFGKSENCRIPSQNEQSRFLD